MYVSELLPIMKKYEICPKCGNDKIGNGQGGIVVEDDTYARTCKCGFKVIVNRDGEEIQYGN